MAKLVSDLDSDAYAVRQAATRELSKLGERAETILRAALKNRPSLEARRRIEELLTRLRRREWSAEQLRERRAVMVLEQIATEEARQVLRSLVGGAADAWMTQDAKAALARLRKFEPRAGAPEQSE